ncbi:uncharacterized protein [Salmo salar]|uniref:Uncharacterized protein n=1 Tax=Salmo salar TaxID=8030 RepID=A0ABM3EBM5_SALSA|nr:uncharacterized protein LOC123733127 [Salmo salar]
MEERIIFAVSSKPCLFDTTADSYRDINTKKCCLETSVHDSRIARRRLEEEVERTQGQVSEREKDREREEEVWVSSFRPAALVLLPHSFFSGSIYCALGNEWQFYSQTLYYIIHKCCPHRCIKTLNVTYNCDHRLHRCSETLYNVYIIHKYDHHRCCETLYNVYIIHKYDHHRCCEILYNVYIIHKYDHHRCSETLYNVYIIHKYHHHRCSHGRR